MFVLDNEGNRLSAKYYHKSFLNNTDKVCLIPFLKRLCDRVDNLIDAERLYFDVRPLSRAGCSRRPDTTVPGQKVGKRPRYIELSHEFIPSRHIFYTFPHVQIYSRTQVSLELSCRHDVAAEIIMLDQYTVVFRSSGDTHFYVVGDSREVSREHFKYSFRTATGYRASYRPSHHLPPVPNHGVQNELILAAVLDCFHEALSTLLRYVPRQTCGP